MEDKILGFFIREYNELDEIQKRTKVGMLSGIIGIVVNIFLVIFKIVAGLLTGAVAITADAANNFSDAASSVVTLIGFKAAGKPADKEHPFGHGRIEYLAGLIVAQLILLMGMELLHSSVIKIIRPEKVIFSRISVVILIVSILAKIFLSKLNTHLGNKFRSTTMLATAKDSRNDVFATSVVLISLVMTCCSDFNFDGYAGAFVAILVIIAGIGTIKETASPLIGRAPDDSMIKGIKCIVLSDRRVYGFHDLIIHDYGPGRKYVSLHAELDKDTPLVEAHKCVDRIETAISEKYNCYISIHVDPIDMGYKKVRQNDK